MPFSLCGIVGQNSHIITRTIFTEISSNRHGKYDHYPQIHAKNGYVLIALLLKLLNFALVIGIVIVVKKHK